MTNTELFNLITAKKDWWKGYCSYTNSKKLLHNHRHDILSNKLYAKLFYHYGYIENIHWKKEK